MYLNAYFKAYPRKVCIRIPKIILVMQFTGIILLAVCLQVSATAFGQKVTIVGTNIPLKKVFKDIRKQTDYNFIYTNKTMKEATPVTLNVQDEKLKTVLEKSFAHQNLTYSIEDNIIIVKSKPLSKQKNQVLPQKEIEGMVVDSTTGEPLVGVTVKVKGSNKGTTTDEKGEFNLIVGDDAILEVSYLGYASKTIALNGKDRISISLASATTGLNQVVVVGYGKQRKSSVTAAISTISGEDLVQSPTANISNALAGRLSGLTALQESGKPGADASDLYVRGIGTYTGENKPLVMVDGVERESFNNIDPNTIASISILKDASATAVYGVRGANGVILITTKRGKNQAPKVSLSAQTAITEFANMPDYVNSYQYGTLLNERSFENYWINHANDPDIHSWSDFVTKRNANWVSEANVYYSPKDLKYYKNAHTPTLANGKSNPYYSPYFYPDVDWISKIFKKYTPQSQVNANITGGTNSVKYFVSLGYLSQGGLFNTDYMKFSDEMEFSKKRYNLRGNFDFNVTKNFKISVDLASRFVNISGMDNDFYIWQKRILWATPLGSPGLIDGKFVLPFNNQDDKENPMLAIVNSNNYNITSNSTLNSTIRLSYNLDAVTPGLSVHAKGAYDSYFSSRTGGSYTPLRYGIRPNPNGDPLDPILVQLNENSPPQRWDNWYNYKWRKLYGEVSLNYDRGFGRHHVTGLLLATREKRYDPSLAFDLPHAYEGFVGRVTYAFANKYLAEFDAGYNGSENFPEGKRFGFLPAISAGWIISQEPFFPENSIVTFLKLRGSVGKVGNDKIGGARYLYLPDTWKYRTGGHDDGYHFGTKNLRHKVQGASEDVIGNPNVTWETATKKNLGIEFHLFKDKLSVNYDYFYEHRVDILSYRGTVPAIVQAELPPYNLGVVDNWGNEIEMKFKESTGAFKYWVKANASTNQNKIVFRDEAILPSLKYQAQTGHRIGQGLYLLDDGLYTSWGDLYELDKNGNPILSKPVRALNKEGEPYTNGKGNPVYQKDLGYAGKPLQPGNVRLVDYNEDGVVDDKDFVRTGKSEIPELSYGISFGFNYKGFDLSVLLQGVEGVAKFAMRELHFNKQQALFKVDWKRFTEERYNAGKEIYFPIAAYNQAAANNTFFLKDASYLRLKNLEIGYTFKPDFLRKIGMTSARLYVNGNNLYTFTHNKLWGNPENLGFIGYPLTRTFNLGINIKF